MPADYNSAAAALSLPPSPPPSNPASSSSSSRASSATSSPRPPWVRARAPSHRRSRLSGRPYARAPLPSSSSSRGRRPASLPARALAAAAAASGAAWGYFVRLPPLQRAAAALAGCAALALAAAALVFGHAIFGFLAPYAERWRALPGGWLIVFALTFCVAFPPAMGYSTLLAVSGFVYGFPGGWPVVAAGSVAGSTAAFFTSRTVFSGYVHRLVGADRRFVALGQVLRRDGLGMLTMIRFCPLPYSLSNGFLATIPSIRWWEFALGTALSSPKLAVHVFIGSRLAKIADEGDRMGWGDKAINYASMAAGGAVGLTVALVIYRRTMRRAAELARDEVDALVADAGADADEQQQQQRMADAQLMDDAAALMDDDDISLWETTGAGVYRDGDGDGDGYGSEAGGEPSWGAPRGGFRDDDEEAAISGTGSHRLYKD